jgi:hypothetical protein
MRCAQCIRFIGIAWHHVNVQRRFQITENRVVDAQRTSYGKQCVTQRRRITHRLCTSIWGKVIEATHHHRVWQQQCIAPQKLLLAQHRPT